MIIDAHAHIYDFLAGYGAKGEFCPLGNGLGIWATGKVERFLPEKYGDKEFLAETLLELMKENSVDHAILLQGGNYGFHNHYIAESAAKYPTKFTAVGTLDPYSIYAEKIFENLIERYAMHALKFELSSEWGLSGYHPRLKMDGDEMTILLERANKLSLTVVLDIGPMHMPSFDATALKVISNRYQNIQFVMTHCFFPCDDKNNDKRLALASELASDRFVFDFSNVAIDKHTDFLKQFKNAVGAERMLWGSDLPGTLCKNEYGEMIRLVTDSGIFTEEELPLVLGKNAEKIYLK